MTTRNTRTGSGMTGLKWLLGDHLGSTTPTTYRFTGQREESSLGIYYYGARWYDSYLNRWTQPDSIIPDPYNTLDYDRYSYARNNPVIYTDPTGHNPLLLLAVLLIAAVVVNGDTPRVGLGEAARIEDLVVAGLQHEKHATIVNEGLQSLQDDPSVQAAQERIVGEIVRLPEYREQPFSINEDISDSFTANGPSGNWKQAAGEGNQAFWMVHSATISATNTKVSADGSISTTWHVHDYFNFIPGPDRSEEYNYWASKAHYIYNELLGAEESFPTDAYWNDTIPPQNENSTPQ